MVFRWVVAVCLLWICVKEKVNMMDCAPKVYRKCHHETSICYTIETDRHCMLSWNEAKRKCEENVASIREGKLAIINTKGIHAFLTASGWFSNGSTANRNGQSKYGQPETFIGLRRISGTWTWLDNSTTINHTNWKDDEHEYDKRCASVKRHDNTVKWKSQRCGESKNYICQYNNYCPAGYGGNQCIMCDIGTYKESAGNDQCSSCESTKTTDGKGSNNATDCVCKRGYQGRSCAECDKGFYKNRTGPEECTTCGAGRTTKSTASTSRENCVYKPGYTDNNCNACPVGKYKEGLGPNNCRTCWAKRTTIGEAATHRSQCVCKIGRGGSNCAQCMIGTYKSEKGNDECTPCGQGKTTISRGSSNETLCVCDVGHGGLDCGKCAIGSYKSTAGADSCTECGSDLITLFTAATSSSHCVSPSLSTCELNLDQLTSNHIVPLQYLTVGQHQTVTLECESGWMYPNSDTSRTLICTGSNMWNATEEACEVNTECAAIPAAERVDCGWDGISRLECEENMCCYTSNGSVPCYFKESRSTIVNVESSSCTFHGKKYSFVSSTGPMNVPCPNDHPTLASLGYEAEFHLLRMCLSLLESYGMAAGDRWIEGRATSSSNHISDLGDYHPHRGTDDNCVIMSTKRANGTDEARPVNPFKKNCTQSAFPICFKHLDVMTLLVSHPVDDGSCKVFDIDDYPEISLWQTFTITDPTSKGYSILRYNMEGLQCEDKTILFSTTKGNATTCQKTRSCEVVKKMPQSKECYRKCPCDEGHCQSTVVVERMTNQNQWSLCPLRLA